MPKALLGDIEIDVLEEESSEYSSDITDKPVEAGANIVDHIRPEPVMYSLTGTIAGAHSEEVYDRLKRYQQDGERLLFASGLDVLVRMVIENLSPRRDIAVSNGFAFDISLKQIRIARPEEAVYVAPDPVTPQQPAGQTVQPAVSHERRFGRQQPNEASVDEETRQSWLYGLGQRFGILE